MRTTLSFVLALFTVATIFVGCKEKPVTTPEDLAAPEIFMTSPAAVAPGQFNNIANTDSFAVDIRFEDDIELARWDLEIRRREDEYFNNKTDSDAWTLFLNGDLSGTVDAINFFINVPFDPLAGPYEFKIKVTDAAGKTATQTTFLFITNSEDLMAPMIRFVQPDTNMIDTFLIGNDLPMRVNVSDGNQIVDVFARVRDAFTNEILPNSEIQIDTLFLFAYQLDTFYTIPAGVVPGKYKVEVYANDQVGNYGYNLDTIYIKPN